MAEPSNPRIFIRCVNCPCMSGAFRKLTAEQLDLVDFHRSELSYAKGEIMCKQGSFLSNMMFVKKGLVKIYFEASSGPTIISLETDGHFIGLPFIYSNGDMVYRYSVEALTNTHVCLVDIGTFKKLIDENNDFAREIIRMLNMEVIKGYEHMFSLSKKQIRGRFAELLLHLRDRIYKKSNFKLTITRRDMSELISTTQESISRLIKEFREDHLIDISGQELKILDDKRLKYISQVG